MSVSEVDRGEDGDDDDDDITSDEQGRMVGIVVLKSWPFADHPLILIDHTLAIP